jgi:hypothetical protein
MDRWQRPTPHAQVAATVVDGQAVIVMADSGQVTVLNDVGTRIWQLSDGKHSVDEIVQTIVAEYEVTPDVAWQDADTFLRRLLEVQAIILCDPPAPD